MTIDTKPEPTTSPRAARSTRTPRKQRPESERRSKIAFRLSTEAKKRLLTHAVQEETSPARVLDDLIRQHLKTWVVQRRSQTDDFDKSSDADNENPQAA